MKPSPEREALQLVVEGAAVLAGFDLVEICSARDGWLHRVAVVGDDATLTGDPTGGPADRAAPGRTESVASLEAETARADAWGAWRFLPHDRGATDGGTEPDVAGSWHPDDRLWAPLFDDEGALRGVLRIDRPTDGRRPDAGRRRILDLYATQALQTLTTAQDRGDFARHHRQELALAEYRAQLVEVLAHELQTPLTAVLGHVELLGDAVDLPIELHRPVAAIGRGVRRMSSLISDLLDLARADDPHRRAATSVVDIGSTVRESCDILLVEAGGRGVELVVEVPPTTIGVRADRADLEALVTNLVSNAIKYSRVGGRVAVTLRGDDDTAVLEVHDQGIGISELDQVQLFRDFFRSRDPEVQERPGTGLGLAIVERVLVRCGGRITVTSTLGSGSTFRVVLPAADGAVDDDPSTSRV